MCEVKEARNEGREERERSVRGERLLERDEGERDGGRRNVCEK